ncbi:MAG: hypothetical protein L0H70_10040, partial [Xanthomonadales bacterium]|nr:hypothetical protein [Xanthomonadales bacterium]
WLVDALIWFGAGAKTAVGYGRFDTDAKATDDAAARINEQHDARERETAMQQRLHGLSPLAQQLERTIAKKGWDDDKNAFAQSGVIEAWLDKLETDMQADAVARFREIVSGHFPGLLEDPDKLQGKKRRPVFNDRQKQFAKRLLALVSKS